MLLPFNQINFNNLLQQIQQRIREKYLKSNEIFSLSSPYGQLVQAIAALGAQLYQYLENIVVDLWDFRRTTNPAAINHWAVLAGHQPGRARGAKGTVKLSLQMGANLEDIPYNQITLFNYTRIQNLDNNLPYLLIFPQEAVTWIFQSSDPILVPIVQAELLEQSFTANEDIEAPLQSFTVQHRGLGSIDEDFIEVLVNDIAWTKVGSMLDLGPNERGCVVRTGLGGGIDVIFGNGLTGQIPPLGATITVRYAVTRGAGGNVNNITNTWSFRDVGYNVRNEEIALNNFLNLNLEIPPQFGTDPENIELTRQLIPLNSRNYVLATPRQIKYSLMRLRYFNYVEVQADDSQTGQVDLILIPDLNVRLTEIFDYYDMDENRFSITPLERERIETYLSEEVYWVLGLDYNILNIELVRFVIVLYVEIYQDCNVESTYQEIVNRITNHFINLDQRTKVTRSSITQSLSGLSCLADSIFLEFKVENNEFYHGLANDNETRPAGYDSDFNHNLNTTGDLILSKNQWPIVRGGWVDRRGIKYELKPVANKHSPITMLVQGRPTRIIN